MANLDREARALLMELPKEAQAEVLDVYSCVSALMATRCEDSLRRAMAASLTQFCSEDLIGGLAIAAGEWVKMLAEGTGRTVDEVVRQTLASRHPDPTDLEMFDTILGYADGSERTEP
jgi:hypothetical protein